MTLEECEMLNILLGVALIIENGKITGFNSRMYEDMGSVEEIRDKLVRLEKLERRG